MQLQWLLSSALILMMFAMGLGLRWQDFTRLMRQPRITLASLAAQMLLLPSLAIAVALGFGLGAAAAAGLLLVALCPSGSTSNFFTRLGQGNTALSVSLTAINSLVSVVTIPIVFLSVAPLLGYQGSGVTLSFFSTVEDIALHTLLPVAVGMLLRGLAPGLSRRIETGVVSLSSGVFFIVVAILWYQNWGNIVRSFATTGVATMVLLGLAMASGWFAGRIIKASQRDKFTMMIEVGIQNGALAFFIAVNLMKDPTLVGAPTVYTVAMVLAAIPAVLVRRFL
ncbi:Pantothenate precursors transporter PanS [BD1-7 clade bacterium]|uniref:Pantothenates transporter PanS n=1 Tax=BD1-7 clade bacterium TaxID=2029982 RepID=A0A5S9QRL2_9GAMM|nr:Pantothenate precursors transporter PanS [BD1-7 clade bacterium]CAA0122039.1 Pantothenate precursors transporter PanS [BD1-7 clade bacterium]